MLNIVLYQPDIAQNVGSIIRTCVVFGVRIHLIEPMGFIWDAAKMKRSGMDYIERADIIRHKSFEHFLETEQPKRLGLLTTKGSSYLSAYIPQNGDYLMFGRESAGVPEHVHAQADVRFKIPMVKGERSLNLAQTCAIVMYDTLSKLGTLPE